MMMKRTENIDVVTRIGETVRRVMTENVAKTGIGSVIKTGNTETRTEIGAETEKIKTEVGIKTKNEERWISCFLNCLNHMNLIHFVFVLYLYDILFHLRENFC